MTAIIIIFIVLLVLSFVTAFILFSKENPQEVVSKPRVDEATILFDMPEDIVSKGKNIDMKEEEEEII